VANPETIAAVATPPGMGGVGIVRVSGSDLASILAAILSRQPKKRVATQADFLGSDGSVIDNGLALYFQGPHSYTGEDVLELQGHGGPVVMHMLLRRCLELGARIAEPGEFTRRAFLNGKLDLAQAEAVADVIAAESESAVRCAIRSLRGEFSDSVNDIDRNLLELRTYVEATLDFPEEDIDRSDRAEIDARLSRLVDQLALTLEKTRQGSILRNGVTAVLAGRPNVGKSSLMNRLAGEEISIVTAVPGTTRDALKHSINLGGIPFHFVDTAGLRETSDEVESIGIRKSWKSIEDADIVLFVVDASRGWTDEDDALLERLPARLPTIVIFNKVDLVDSSVIENARITSSHAVWVSARTGNGIDRLIEIARTVCGLTSPAEDVFLGRARHLEALQTSLSALVRARNLVDAPELMAEELRSAHRAFGTITGQISADDLLGEIFSSFCIGK
jgi:tRNA modification GTPase